LSGGIDDINKQITSAIIMAANGSILRSKNRISKKCVQWWTEECCQTIKRRNKAFRQVMQHLIQYKKLREMGWRHFCNTIGITTLVGEVWGMIKRIGGERRESEYLVLTSEKVGERHNGQGICEDSWVR